MLGASVHGAVGRSSQELSERLQGCGPFRGKPQEAFRGRRQSPGVAPEPGETTEVVPDPLVVEVDRSAPRPRPDLEAGKYPPHPGELLEGV